jgi:hypothetical protein
MATFRAATPAIEAVWRGSKLRSDLFDWIRRRAKTPRKYSMTPASPGIFCRERLQAGDPGGVGKIKRTKVRQPLIGSRPVMPLVKERLSELSFARTHLSLEKDAPIPRAVQVKR